MMNRPVRILELRSVLGAGGGPEKTILLGASRADRQYPVTVASLRDNRDGAFSIAERAARLGIDYVEIVEGSSFDPRVVPALQRLVRSRQVDIVHAHDYKTDLLALLLARLEGTVAIATAHGWTGHSRRERLVYYALDKQLLRAFPRTIAVSGEIRAELIKHRVPAERVDVVLNGIDHRAFRRDRGAEAAARADAGISPDDVVIGSVGRLEPQKRFDLLIRACALLRERWPQLRLLIAGDGSRRTELNDLAARLLPAHAYRLCGHTADVSRLHHTLDVFVQSSDYEGTSNAVLEAMALETPLVATAAGGTAEMMDDEEHGLIVPCGDLAALASAIERTLLERDQTAARVARARRRVETTLSFDRRVAAVERIYGELAERFPRISSRRVTERCA